jgi:hypothetical protein
MNLSSIGRLKTFGRMRTPWLVKFYTPNSIDVSFWVSILIVWQSFVPEARVRIADQHAVCRDIGDILLAKACGPDPITL